MNERDQDEMIMEAEEEAVAIIAEFEETWAGDRAAPEDDSYA